MNKWCEKEIKIMVKRISRANSAKAVYELFDKILTPREINDMARRLTALELIEKGKSYTEIAMKLGMSSATISKISSKIGFGFRRCDTKILGDKRKGAATKIKR